MGTVASLCEDWASGDGERERIYVSEKGVMARWVSKAQEIFAEKSECLRGLWEPIITTSGYIALPSDFGREIVDMVKWNNTTRLSKMDYPKAINRVFSGTYYYSIWGGNFYVWSAASGSPQIPYVKKPVAITVATLPTADMEVPTEYHRDFFYYFDSMFLRKKLDLNNSTMFYKMFTDAADNAKVDYGTKNDAIPTMRGTFF